MFPTLQPGVTIGKSFTIGAMKSTYIAKAESSEDIEFGKISVKLHFTLTLNPKYTGEPDKILLRHLFFPERKKIDDLTLNPSSWEPPSTGGDYASWHTSKQPWRKSGNKRVGISAYMHHQSCPSSFRSSYSGVCSDQIFCMELHQVHLFDKSQYRTPVELSTVDSPCSMIQ